MQRSALRAGVVLAALVLTAGCSGGGPAQETVSAPTVNAPTASVGTSTGFAPESGQADPDKEIRLANRWNRTVEVHLLVVRDATNETVHDEVYVLDPGTDDVVYDLSRADPDGVESFTVQLHAVNETANVSIATSKCYGDVTGSVSDEGEFELRYAIC